MDPECPLAHMVLGEVYLQMGALDDALREFRAAAEIDPESAEAREKAEEVRRQITHPHHDAPPAPVDPIKALLARVPRKLIPVIAGVVAGLLVFTVGAAAIVTTTSPTYQTKRAYQRQMALGGQYYREKRYAEAAGAFRQAQALYPQSMEARRRFEDAQKMAGLSGQVVSLPPAPPVFEAREDVATASATPGQGAFGQVWVGPGPGGVTAPPPTHPTVPPPPSIPAPTRKRSGDNTGPPLPPLPPSTGTDGVEGPSRQPPGSAASSGSEAPPPASSQATAKPPTGGVTVWRVTPPQRPKVAPSQPPVPQPSAADLARREADRLRFAGNNAEAARKYADAATGYRAEASRGGPQATANASAADVCEKARRLCESQAH